MSRRTERIREYADPCRMENWRGASRDKENIERWSERAHQNSDGHRHRAKSGAMELPSTAERPARSDDRPVFTSADRDRAPRAQGMLNHDPDLSPYMKKVRRQA